jgi:hypothetical protein
MPALEFFVAAKDSSLTPMSGFGQSSRIPQANALTTWELMVSAVESLEQPSATIAPIETKIEDVRRAGLMKDSEQN